MSHPLAVDLGIGGHDRDAESLYHKLSSAVLPLYYDEPARWRWMMMQQATGNLAHYFNSQP